MFPNPMVGAVVLDDRGNILGEAFHPCCGEPHAEIAALGLARGKPGASTLVVTLEPCAHQGRTPPCVETIAGSGVKRVVAAMIDPDPRVSGKGAAYLREHGVQVEVGLYEERARELNRVWIHCRRTGRSFLHLKMAASLDGRAAATDGSSRWITGAAARARVHEMRAASHAVMIGSGTALSDDPSLGTGDGGGPGPLRIVITRTPLPGDLKLYTGGGPTVTAVPEGLSWRPPGDKIVFSDLGDLLEQTLSMDLGLVFCEGGPRLATALINQGLVDRVSVFTAPILLGSRGVPVFHDLWVTGIGDALTIEDPVVEILESDTLMEGKLVHRTD